MLETLPIYISEFSGWTTTAWRAELQRQIAQHKIEWMLLDYESLMADDPDLDENTRSKRISSRVHGTIKDLGLAGLVVDDLNKAGIGNESAGKAQLAGSARKIYDADTIVFMRKHKTNTKWVTLTWEKEREGEPDKFMDLKRSQGWPAFEETTIHV